MEVYNLTTDQIVELLREMNDFTDRLDPEDELIWMSKQLAELYRLCLDVNQVEYPDVDIYPCTKVVKLRRFIDAKDLTRLGYRQVVMSGVFVALDGVVVSNEIADAIFKDNKGYLESTFVVDSDGVKHKLTEVYHAGSIQLLANGKYFMPLRSEICPSILNMTTSYQVLNL